MLAILKSRMLKFETISTQRHKIFNNLLNLFFAFSICLTNIRGLFIFCFDETLRVGLKSLFFNRTSLRIFLYSIVVENKLCIQIGMKIRANMKAVACNKILKLWHCVLNVLLNSKTRKKQEMHSNIFVFKHINF